MDEKSSLLDNKDAPLNQPFISHAVTHGNSSEATINCQVCDAIVPLGNKEKQLVVKCLQCNEATPIKGPPVDKQYVRCPCNCLLICKATTTRVGCPRSNCQRIIALSRAVPEPLGPQNLENTSNTSGAFPSRNGSFRVTCGNCHRPFSIPSPPNTFSNDHTCPNRMISCLSGGSAPNSNFLIAARCPQCHKITSVGQAYARVRWVGYLILSALFLIFSVVITASTIVPARSNNVLYFLWSVFYLLFVIFVIRFIIFYRMRVSALEVSVTRA